MSDAFQSLSVGIIALLFAIALVLVLLLANAIGRRAAARSSRRPDLGTMETMASGLVGLLLAFDFSIAQSRFDRRQEVLVHEADAIGTAWLRCSILPPEEGATCQRLLAHYVTVRLDGYRAFGVSGGEARVRSSLNESERIQTELWQLVSDAVRNDANPARVSLMTAVNSIIDLDTDRRASLRIQVPVVVSFVIVLSCLAWAVLLGYSSGLKDDRPHPGWLVSGLLISLVFGVALDFDRPRSGFITTSAAERALENLQSSMIDKPPN